MSWIRRALARRTVDHGTSAQETNDLIAYLVVRFIVVLAVVMAAESLRCG